MEDRVSSDIMENTSENDARLNKMVHLVDLASEPSSDRRRELLREITDVFLDKPESYNETENWYFGDILGKVAYELETEMRRELAEKLGDHEAAPRELVNRLARDEIEVARPVIERSPVLSQDDLVEIAQVQSQDHLLAITKRSDIGEQVSTVLVDRGDDNVVKGLVENNSAVISKGSLQVVADRAEKSEVLQASLLRRPDLPYDMMKGMVAKLSNDIREKILSESNDVDRNRLENALQEVTAHQESKLNLRRNQQSKPEVVIADLVANNALTPQKLITFAREQRIPEFVCGLAKLANIDLETAEKVTLDRSGEGLALTCRAGGLPPNQFAEMMHALNPLVRRSQQDMSQLVQTYERLAVPTAQRILRFWRVRRSVADDTAA